jgi:CzcA family heavy metal efflux pump
VSHRGALFDVLEGQRRFIYLIIVLCSVGGVWAALRLPSAIYPELTFPRITIVVEGSSLGARQVVFSVTRPIEEAVSVVPGVIRVLSKSIRGASEIAITFSPTTDMTFALQQVQARVNQARQQMPPDLDIEVERMTPSLFPILSYNLEGGDPATLFDLARYQIKPVISRIPGVGRVDVQGTDVREIEVVADPARLVAQGLSYEELADAIRQGTAATSVGRVAKDYRQYLVVSAQEAHSVADVQNVVLPGGLRVRDVATVSMGTEDHVRIIVGDGRPAALVNISRQIGGNTVAVADSVARAMTALRNALPPGVRLNPVYDQAALVRDAVTSVRDAMLIGALLAVGILLLFLRHARITAISAASIPLTMAVTVFVMWRVGQTFNLMTLGAMAIATGLVIDDAVVITENIVRHMHLTSDRTTAVRDAVQELIWPVTSSTLTTVVVFLPLGLLQGVVGQFFAALSLTLVIAVLVSLVLALTIIPLLSEQFLRAGDVEQESAAPAPRRGILARVGSAVDAVSDRYESALGGVLHHGRWMVLAAALLVVGGVVVYNVVGTGFLPEMDEGAFVLDFWTPGGTALAESDRQLHLIDDILAVTPEVSGSSRRLGAEMGLFATQQNRGDYVVRLRPRSQRDRDIFAVMDEVRDKVTQVVPRMRIEFVQILSDVIDDLSGAARPVEIRLFGSNLDSLEAYGTRLGEKLQPVAGLEDLFNGVSEPSAEMAMRVDAAEAGRIGMTPEQVSAAVRGALLGANAGEVRLEDRSVAVRVRAPDSVRYDALRIGALPVRSPQTHAAIPLGSLATFTTHDTRAELFRENQQQMITVTAGVSGRSLGDVMTDVRRILAQTRPPAGVRLELAGRYAGQRDAFRALLLVLALASASVVAIMVIQFRSFVEPLVVLLAAPLSFVGAMLLLLVTGTPLNVSSFMGLILLVGLIVKNGIILLDFTKHRMRDAGLPLDEAIREAGRVRLRPILMTTLCTLFGLLPLALGLGAGSELQRPLALAVIGGLTLSTPITLFVVPTLLVALRGRGYREPGAAPPAPAAA